MRPLDVLIEIADLAMVMDAPRRPGAFIERLSAARREALQDLKSDDALRVRLR